MQTCLEKRGIAERSDEIRRSDYNIEDQYSATHSDALSNGDPQGKGSGHGGHTHWLPDCNKPTSIIDYSNFDTSPKSAIGGSYDIEGRNGIGGRERSMAFSMFNYENQYGAALVDTSANQAQGQYVMKTVK
jgi:hypothetical protein